MAETLKPPEGAVTHWSRARLAERVGVSALTVGRVWRETNLKPHRSETFKDSNDPDGRVTHDTRERHTGADFLAFLKRIARAYPQGDVHLILDDVSTHETPAVQAWLVKHKRFVFHFTPTSASWMNQIETWFGILTRQALRRGSFDGVRPLVAAIDAFTSEWNDRAAPFAWVESADEILAKATRTTEAHSDASH